MTKLLGIAGLAVGAAIAYAYYKQSTGNDVASSQVSNTSTASVPVANAGATISTAPPKPTSIVNSGVQVSTLRFGSVAQDAPNQALSTPVLFKSRYTQGFS